MPESTLSLGSKDLYSNLSLNDQSMDNSSMKAIYEADMADTDDNGYQDEERDEHLVPTISRPLSRSSVTSGLSMTATKDGVEGRRVQRYGIPQYSLNLLNSMSQSYWKPKKNNGSNVADELDSPIGPPMTLREKIKLLSTDALSRTGVEDSRLDSVSLNGMSRESLTPSKLQQQPRELQENLLNDFNNPNVIPRVNSELETNLSTMGDDMSYLHDMKNIPSVLVAADSDND
ncbi:uncharacterized protein KLLA0_C07601g [Kluyveromyces lactis]|uniref:KLLA0C07601p n=1 Tax=Kluyveromyces lactis (strain ATCC 8585 / CBS 2359 / DSM 70799 / NBRC 1267 / NRRL Y-1140 / WM37) TaxID=284590 RepID=Q6CU51_KLULA|nr:uncharacterized protein KLLA0_C07601g [Kluyveromyces lactis]CAH01389.1 KLLA0C07601p [Kluyveromyces lactis]|eukprot:XP_452538.1 uncharacterized protein KLLA0_C07601g [Kluyveromyces lactis]